MKAITVKEAGAANTLKVVDLPNPKPKKNEVIIKQTYAGVNYGDVIRRKRGLFELNEEGYFIPGFEGTGKIISVGNEVKKFKIGDRVSYLSERNGGYSQQICIGQQSIFKVSDDITDETAAVMTCVGLTAWHLLKLSGAKDNDWVMIHGATGGVGLVLTQLCLLKGIKVIALVGTQRKKEFLKRYDTTEIIIRGKEDISEKVNLITRKRGVVAIFDCVGQAVLDTNIGCIGEGGTILYYGSTSGHSAFPGLQLLMNSLKIQGFNIFNLKKDISTWEDGLQNFLKLLSQNKVEIYIDNIFRMKEAYKAHELLENRNSIGKLLLDLR